MDHIPYILQVQICIALFWLAYRLFMRRSGAFGNNRIYLLALIGASFAIPAVSIPVWPSAPAVQGTIAVGDFEAWFAAVQETEAAAPLGWQTVAGWICLAGILAMLAGVAYHLLRMARAVHRSQVTKLGNARIVRNEKIVAPYSFFNYIFIGEKEAGSREYPQIVAHEMAHVRLGHSYDSVFAQAMLVLFWWNPFVWLWNRSLKEVHEYQADDAVLNQGYDSKQYITLLIGTLADIHPEFVSGFGYSLIKNRLLMMTRQKGRFAPLRLMAAIPILAGTLMLFSFTEKPREATAPAGLTEQTVVTGSPAPMTGTASETTAPKTERTAQPAAQPQTAPPPEEPFVVVENMPKFQGGDVMAFRNWIMREVKYPADAIEKSIQGRVLIQFVIEKDGTVSEVTALENPNKILADESVRVISSSPKWTPGTQRGQEVRVRLVLPVDFSLSDGSSQTRSKPVSGAVLSIRGDAANAAEPGPTIMVNDKEYTGGIDKISPDAIKSINVIKDDSNYPEGLIQITLKDGEPATLPDRAVTQTPSGEQEPIQVVGYATVRKDETQGEDPSVKLRINTGDQKDAPLFIINGKVASGDEINELEPKNIESITVLKDAKAAEQYGEDGKNGVVIIQLKE